LFGQYLKREVLVFSDPEFQPTLGSFLHIWKYTYIYSRRQAKSPPSTAKTTDSRPGLLPDQL
ncbi:MAG: hypothetical protein WCD68_12710, partial [Candidatus Acidiferrum sp.]